jgi:anti-anti-sigma factor
MPERQPRPDGASVEPTTGPWAVRDQTPRIVYNTHRDRLIAHGVLDVAFTGQLAYILAATLAEHPTQIVLDLDHVWLIDAGTIRVLLAYQAHTAAAGCDLHIVNAHGVVQHVLQLTGVLPPPRSGRTRRWP